MVTFIEPAACGFGGVQGGAEAAAGAVSVAAVEDAAGEGTAVNGEGDSPPGTLMAGDVEDVTEATAVGETPSFWLPPRPHAGSSASARTLATARPPNVKRRT
jgi:hypothetical protein